MERYPFDDAYVHRLREGDPWTEDHFFSFFQTLLLAKLRRRMLRGRPPTIDAIDDIRQEVYSRVLRTVKEGRLREGRALGGFVDTVCNNVLSEQNRIPPADQLDETKHDPPAAGDDSETKLIDEETKRLVRKLLAVPGRDAEILRAIFLEERDKDEICREFGVDRGYLRVLLHRALKRLRDDF